MYDVDFDLKIHIRGTVYCLEEKPESEEALLNEIFPDGWEGEVLGVEGDMDVICDEEEDEADEAD